MVEVLYPPTGTLHQFPPGGSPEKFQEGKNSFREFAKPRPRQFSLNPTLRPSVNGPITSFLENPEHRDALTKAISQK